MSNWQTKKFVDICLPKEGLKRCPFGSAIKKEFFVADGNKVYEQSNAIYDDAFRWNYYINDEKYKELIHFNVLPGDIIVSCSGTLGRISVIPSNAKKGVINQALLRIRILENIVSKKYFLYFFRSADFQRKILVQSQGTAMTNMVGMKDFKEIEIPLPDLTTQQAIVSKIEELFSDLDKGIEELKKAQEQLKVYRQSVLKWAFEGKLTNEKIKVKTIPLGSIVKIVSGNTPKGLENISNIGEFQFYKVSDMNIEGNEIEMRTSKLNLSLKDIEKLKIKLYPKGSVIFPKRGGAIFTNKKRKLSQKSSFDLNVMGALPNENVDANYLYYWFQKLDLGKICDGSNIPQINNKNIEPLDFEICSLKEQQLIVEEIERRLSVADKMEEGLKQSLAKAESLRQSILKKAFSGELV